MKIRAVVFDLDGTLANTAELTNGRRVPYDVLSLSPPEGNAEHLKFGDSREQLPGKLATLGYRTAIVTASPSAYASTLLDLLLVDFERLLAGSVVYSSKAQKLKALAEYWEMQTSELIYIGDKLEDEEAAVEAGAEFLHVDRIAELHEFPRVHSGVEGNNWLKIGSKFQIEIHDQKSRKVFESLLQALEPEYLLETTATVYAEPGIYLKVRYLLNDAGEGFVGISDVISSTPESSVFEKLVNRYRVGIRPAMTGWKGKKLLASDRSMRESWIQTNELRYMEVLRLDPDSRSRDQRSTGGRIEVDSGVLDIESLLREFGAHDVGTRGSVYGEVSDRNGNFCVSFNQENTVIPFIVFSLTTLAPLITSSLGTGSPPVLSTNNLSFTQACEMLKSNPASENRSKWQEQILSNITSGHRKDLLQIRLNEGIFQFPLWLVTKYEMFKSSHVLKLSRSAASQLFPKRKVKPGRNYLTADSPDVARMSSLTSYKDPPTYGKNVYRHLKDFTHTSQQARPEVHQSLGFFIALAMAGQIDNRVVISVPSTKFRKAFPGEFSRRLGYRISKLNDDLVFYDLLEKSSDGSFKLKDSILEVISSDEIKNGITVIDDQITEGRKITGAVKTLYDFLKEKHFDPNLIQALLAWSVSGIKNSDY